MAAAVANKGRGAIVDLRGQGSTVVSDAVQLPENLSLVELQENADNCPQKVEDGTSAECSCMCRMEFPPSTATVEMTRLKNLLFRAGMRGFILLSARTLC